MSRATLADEVAVLAERVDVLDGTAEARRRAEEERKAAEARAAAQEQYEQALEAEAEYFTRARKIGTRALDALADALIAYEELDQVGQEYVNARAALRPLATAAGIPQHHKLPWRYSGRFEYESASGIGPRIFPALAAVHAIRTASVRGTESLQERAARRRPH